MSIFQRLTRSQRAWLGIAAIPAVFLLSQSAHAQLLSDNFDTVALNAYQPALKGPEVAEPAEIAPAAASEPALAESESAEPAPSDCLDEMEQECLESPSCDYQPGYSDYCAQCKAELASCLKCMAAQGITYDIDVPMFYQGVTHGGINEDFDFGGKVDQFIILDGGKLWGMDGFSVTMHVETRYGEDVNFDAVGLAPANVAMLMPKEGEHDTAITNLTFQQALSEEWLVAFGKFNAIDMWQGLFPQTGRGVDGFMNASMVFPLGAGRVVPVSFMGAGVTKLYNGKPQAGVLVFDNQNVATTSGFDDMFDNGANILAYYRFFHNLDGLPGSQTVGGVWATGEYASFDPLSFAIVPGQGVVVDRESGAFSFLYILEQTMWVDNCNKNRNIGLLSQWTISDENTSPFSWSCNVGLQGQGLLGGRPADRAGVGYFHSALSDDFVDSLSPVFTLGDVDGVELYYNAQVTKGFNLTADLQVIEPAEEQLNTAVVVGVRGVIGL